MSVMETPQPPAQPAQPAPVQYGGVEPYASGLQVNAYRLEDQDAWVFCAILNGVPVPLVRGKLGGIDDDLQEQATPGFKEKRAQQYARDVLGINRL